jgi:glycosyltransferase involved in cell wall biosynthesis
MFDYSVVICGCTQNSAKYIQENLAKLYQMKNVFKEFHFVVYENDSRDNTAQELQKFKEGHPNFNCICEKNIQQNISIPWTPHTRSVFIAYCRNQLLKYINTYCSNYDFMIMVDLDDVISVFNVKQLNAIFSYDVEQWDALFANCIGKYYDIWALRVDLHVWIPEVHEKFWKSVIDYDCWEKARMYNNPKKYVNDNQIVIPVTAPLIPVKSAFGGFGIYKISKLKNCWYSGIADNKIICEHVPFHRQLCEMNGAKLFICPAFLVNQQPNHTK